MFLKSYLVTLIETAVVYVSCAVLFPSHSYFHSELSIFIFKKMLSRKVSFLPRDSFFKTWKVVGSAQKRDWNNTVVETNQYEPIPVQQHKITLPLSTSSINQRNFMYNSIFNAVCNHHSTNIITRVCFSTAAIQYSSAADSILKPVSVKQKKMVMGNGVRDVCCWNTIMLLHLK